MNDPQGSMWRKWDLHCHTPASFDYHDKSVSTSTILGTLLKSQIAAVAITDHHIIDVPRLQELKTLAGNVMTVFPGIEFRSELGGSESVHYVGIFPPEYDITNLWTKLQGTLQLTEADIEAKGGHQRVYVPFEQGAKLIRELGGIVTVHAGKKANSIESICNAHEFKQAVKEDMAKNFIDVLEIGRVQDEADYRAIVFPHIGHRLPLLICSDNHDINVYSPPTKCWIKADTTFSGLCQVLNEPFNRVYLGETPPILERVSRNRTKYVKSVSFARSASGNTKEAWFHDEVPFNHELVAVIGNKGSGKSALADILGLLGNSPQGDSFSFLNADQFRDPKCNKACCFDATLTWESGTSVTKNLNDSVDSSAIENIKYVPQSHLEKICNEFGAPGKTSFSTELRAVIFSHVDEANRLSMATLEDLIEYRTQETNSAIQILQASLQETVKRFVALQERAGSTHKQTLENQLAQAKQKLAAHDDSKPSVVKKPSSDPETQKRIEAVAQQIEAKAKEVIRLEAEIKSLKTGRAADVKAVSLADKLLGRIKNFQAVLEQFKTDSSDEWSSFGITFEDVVKVNIGLEPIQVKRDKLVGDARAKAEALRPENITGPEFKRLAEEKEIAELKKKLDEPNLRYQAYLKATKDWKDKRESIVGTVDAVGSIRYYEQQLALLAEVPKEIETTRRELKAAARQIHDEIAKLANIYRDFYHPVQDFIKQHPLARDKFHLGFRADISTVNFEDRFLAFINQGRRGSFCGVDEGRTRLRGLTQRADFQTAPGVEAFLDEVILHLESDVRVPGEPVKVTLKDQLRKDKEEAGLLEFLFSLDYLKPEYTLTWGDRDVEQLSPGERGTLLLVFYLLIDRSDIPLVVDQPEENLDNQTVYDILVPSIKEAKSRRQIIIITHNPNLAVVCDADQVIWASLFKDDTNRVDYVTGAIENPIIKPKVVDILEGTQPAFDNRDAKYRSVDKLPGR